MFTILNFFFIISRNLIKNFGKRGLTFLEVVSMIALIFVCLTIALLVFKSTFNAYKK